jgi:glycosyltransferase involved in cell wall biosynthesis
MKILFITENFPPEMNAAATRVYERACYWIKWGHEVTVITCAPNFPQGRVFDGYENKWYQKEEMNGINVIRVKTYMSANSGTLRRILDFVSFMVTGFFASIFQKKHDVVVATSPQFFAAVCGWMVGIIRRTPFVFELGDLWPASITAVGAMKDNLFLRLMEKFELFLYRQSSCVAALTKAFKQDLIKRNIPAEKIGVVINGVDLPRYSPGPKDKALEEKWNLTNSFVVGYIGTHGMAHALENVIYAAEILHKQGHNDIKFLFVGPGAAREGVMKLTKEKQLTNVVFVPAQPKEKMPEFWRLCDLALVHLKDNPVFESVIPSKIFEAMGMGLPILLASPEGEASEIIKKEEAGSHIKAEEPQVLGDEVIKLKENKELYKKLAKNSLEASPRYSREKQATDMLTVIKCASSGKGSSVAEELNNE